MTDTSCLSPSDRFNSLVEGLFNDVATRAANGWFPLSPIKRVLIKLIWRRLRRMSRRFAAIMARFHAGTLPQPGTPPEAGTPPAPDGAPPPAAADELAPDRPADVSEPEAGPPPSRRPRPHQPSRCSGWVIHAVSWFVMMRHYELQEMLDDPEVAAQVAAAPQLGSVLRPLCHMLDVKPPPWLRLPRRPRPSRRRVIPPAPDWIINEPGAILKPDGTVWQRWGASVHWNPRSDITFAEAQKFDRPRRIWPPWD